MKVRAIKKYHLARARCSARGHLYLSPTFRCNVLYFCARCHREMFDRTFDDIDPMTDDEIDEMHRFNDLLDQQ